MACGGRRTPLAVALTFVLTILPACSGDAAMGSGRAVIRDSSGVQIVEYGAFPSIRDITTEPRVDIGGNAQVPEYDIGPVMGAALLDDGRIAVANQSTSEVRFYDSTGSWLTSSGRTGDGPGEYRALAGLWRGAADSLLAFDFTRQSLSILAPDGEFVRLITIGAQFSAATVAGGSFTLTQPSGVLGDGSVLATQQTGSITPAQQGIGRDTRFVVRFASDGTLLDTVAAVPGPETEYLPLSMGGQTVNLPNPVPFGRNSVVAAGPTGVYVARNDRFEVEVRDSDGSLRRLLRVQEDPDPVTGEEAEIHRATLREQMERAFGQMPASLRQSFLDRVDKATYAATYPWVEAILPGPDGTIWVQSVQRPGIDVHRYVVFDSAGTLVDHVRMPPGVRIVSVHGRRVLGLWKDADDVEHLRVYQIQ